MYEPGYSSRKIQYLESWAFDVGPGRVGSKITLGRADYCRLNKAKIVQKMDTLKNKGWMYPLFSNVPLILYDFFSIQDKKIKKTL